MPLSRTVLERQLQLAEQNLAHRGEALQKAGRTAEAYALDPAWRKASADCTSVRRRLNAVAATEAITAEVARVKAEKETAE